MRLIIPAIDDRGRDSWAGRIPRSGGTPLRIAYTSHIMDNTGANDEQAFNFTGMRRQRPCKDSSEITSPLPELRTNRPNTERRPPGMVDR